jgi:hypothetical protein
MWFGKKIGPSGSQRLKNFLVENLRKNAVIGVWGFSSEMDFKKFSVRENNDWLYKQVINFVQAFAGLLVPKSIELVDYKNMERIVEENIDLTNFNDEFKNILDKFAQPIGLCRLNLANTGLAAIEPLPAPVESYLIWSGPGEDGLQLLAVGFNYFTEQVAEGENNNLWQINQPRLSEALKKWESISKNKIDVVRTTSKAVKIERHGFAKPLSLDIHVLSSLAEDSLDEDSIPDMDLLM